MHGHVQIQAREATRARIEQKKRLRAERAEQRQRAEAEAQRRRAEAEAEQPTGSFRFG